MSLTLREEALRTNPLFLLLQASTFIPAAVWIAPIIRQEKNRWRSVILDVTTCRKLSFTTLCYVFVSSRVPICCPPFPRDLLHRTTSVRNSPSPFSSPRSVRMLTRLAINLFAVLNVILFYCWIKRTGNLTVRPVHITCPSYMSHVIEERYSPERAWECKYQSVVKKKRTKYDVINKTILPIN